MAIDFLSNVQGPVYNNHNLIVEVSKEVGTFAFWDFNTALGTNLRDKYESLYIKLVEITNMVIYKGGVEGYFWIATSPEVAAMFEASNSNLTQTESQIKLGSNDVRYVGILDRRWKVWSDPLMDSSCILIGVGEERNPPTHYGLLKISNFIM